jgi:hypothetical protein
MSVPVCLDVAAFGEKFRVQICQHTGKWISVDATIYGADNRVPAFLWAEFPKSQHVLSGTSGSPAFNNAGSVVAVVSATGESSVLPHKTVLLPCVAGALPGVDAGQLLKEHMTYQAALLRCPLLHLQQPMPVDTENPRLLQLCFDVLVLMPMDQ